MKLAGVILIAITIANSSSVIADAKLYEEVTFNKVANVALCRHLADHLEIPSDNKNNISFLFKLICKSQSEERDTNQEYSVNTMEKADKRNAFRGLMGKRSVPFVAMSSGTDYNKMPGYGRVFQF